MHVLRVCLASLQAITPLHVACQEGAYWAVAALVDAGSDLTARSLDDQQVSAELLVSGKNPLNLLVAC